METPSASSTDPSKPAGELQASTAAAAAAQKADSPSSADTPPTSQKTPLRDQMESSLDESEANTVVQVEKDDNGFQYYKCRFCGLTYNYMNTLRAHERIHNVEMPYVCAKCGESFHFSCQLEFHCKQHSEISGYKCECGRTFYSYTELLYHTHPGEEPNPNSPLMQNRTEPPGVMVSPSIVQCTLNEAAPSFMTKGTEPKYSLKTYNDVRTKPYICEYCSKSYSDSRGLAYHMYSHRGEKIFNPRASRYIMNRVGHSYTENPSTLIGLYPKFGYGAQEEDDLY